MVFLNCSSWLFNCGWYTVVGKCIVPSSLYIVAKNLRTNWVHLPVSRYVGMPYSMNQRSINTFATCMAVIFDV